MKEKMFSFVLFFLEASKDQSKKKKKSGSSPTISVTKSTCVLLALQVCRVLSLSLSPR